MERIKTGREFPVWVLLLLSMCFAVFNYIVFADVATRWIVLAAGVGMIILFAVGDLKRLWNLPSLFLLGYVVFSMLTVFWAMSGKFFLREYSKIFIATFFFLLVVLWPRSDGNFVRHVMGIIAGASAIYAVLSVEAATTGYTKEFLTTFAGIKAADIAFSGSRLGGAFGNSNVEASIYAIGIWCSFSLTCRAEEKKRMLFIALFSINLFAFLLAFSLGAMACFAVAMIIYLVFAKNGRYAALIRMIEGFISAGVCVFIAFLSFRNESNMTVRLIPLLLIFLCAVFAVEMELRLFDRFLEIFQKNGARILKAAAIACFLIIAYVVAGMHIGGAYKFGEGITRNISLQPGEHTLQIDADGDVRVSIYSQNIQQILISGGEWVFNDPYDYATPAIQNKEFTVPEGSVICTVSFRAQAGSLLRSVKVDGVQTIPLRYLLLPDFVINRLRGGITTSMSFAARSVMRMDGLKLFQLSPLYGHGVGAFETGITRVQDYYYETRYVHNHYIQVMLEDGLIGILLFIGTIISLAICLWKNRRQSHTEEYFWFYPALCAELVMSALQMMWDVSMSYYAFLVCFHITAALIVKTCAAPLYGIESQNAGGSRGKSIPLRVVCMIIPLFFIVTVGENLFVKQMLSREFPSHEEAYKALERSVSLDLYERNDVMLTYIMMSMNDGEEAGHQQTADAYAERLSKVQSNQLPYYLAGYYFNTKRYGRCVDEAKLGAVYSVSDSDMWNQIAGLLTEGFIDSGIYSPLIQNDSDGAVMKKMVEYREMLLDYNRKALVPVKLNERSQFFFDTVAALDSCNGDLNKMVEVLVAEGNLE